MFTRLLIANRGEIAVRVARTARRLGIHTIAVYSDADAGAMHVSACEEAVHIGGPRAQDSYLRGDAILAAAKRTGAQAIHPGYGFLSENPQFAAACRAAGIVFVGPSPEAIAAMGSKSAAKALMERAGVPLTPGYHGDEQGTDYLLDQARRIGFPVLIKAVSGGGGKGMRRVDRAEDFAAALASCQREAQSSFKDARVLVERYITTARHIEVQVFGDDHGGALYLFERDCSVQRRHQKVAEEAPAPGMTAERRRQMGEAAVAAARAVAYSGAGTVEFIAEPSGEFYFMEMNTRLQVEHPVTEAITGLDLVEWQLRVASGEKLPLRQQDLRIDGHAIEVRIYAEDPARDFLPSIGELVHLRTPETSTQVRIDTGVRQGDGISPWYDPMIAKLIVHGATRAEAIARLRTALAQYEIAGVSTNVEFLHRLTSAPSFVDARLDTALIERERAHLLPGPGAPPEAAWQLAASVSVELPEGGINWADTSGWRMNGSRGSRPVILRSGDEQRVLTVDFSRPAAPAGRAVRVRDQVHVFDAGHHHVFTIVDPYLPPAEAADHHGGLTAPMPGRVLAVLVSQGQQVARGAPLVVMEAMKMEHTVTAPRDGEVERLCCAAGDQVKEGAELLVLN
ncbi:MAG TPA: acetyl/propionyl/methylcrotonyl-CoA carboxylase subunit alpha [Steroidobacteraceae bacterium]|nr:acetyl/propionyl/methylcrotonyl-CoA carboxylase subunit alpha [Steroidobacteraceae bacterium]